ITEWERAGFATKTARTDPQHISTSGFARRLRHAGLIKNKHIPAKYLRASIAQRAALLSGLMDSDGGIEASSTASFCNANKRIVDGVFELIISLGMRATES